MTKGVRVMNAGRALFVGLVLAGFSGAAHATTVLYDNLAAATSGPFTVADTSNGGIGPLGASFQTGATSVSDINVQLRMGLNGTATGSFMVFIANDNGSNSPILTPIDTIESSVSDSSLPASGYTTTNWSASLSTPLAANKTYWLIVQEVGNTAATWAETSDTATGTGVSGNYFYASGYGGAYSNDSSGVAMLMAINDTTGAVPEPATLSLLGMGLLGLAFARRRLFG